MVKSIMRSIKSSIAVIFTLIACSCGKEIITPAEFYVTIDKSTTFKAGEPVKFKLNGEADYYMFYSGEQGHEYCHKNRTEVELEDVRSATLTLSTTPELWGYQGDFVSFWISDTFEGLTGDRETDFATMEAEEAGGMQGWHKLDYVMGPDQTEKTDIFDITPYLGHFCFAVHYKSSYKRPETYTMQGSPTFNISGTLNVDIDGIGERVFRFPMMQREFVFMNHDEQGRPYEIRQSSSNYWTFDYYYASTYNGTTEIRTHMPTEGLTEEEKSELRRARTGGIAFDWTQGDVRFTGTSPGVHHFGVDIWVVYTAMQLNSVERDTGDVVKNLQNDLYKFQYTYDEPGYYKATFHGFNVTVDKRYDTIIEVPLIITE